MKASAKFIDQGQSDFFPVLRKKVNHYFKDNQITRYGNREMIIKSVVLITVYLGTYLAVLLLSVNPWFLLPLAILMGVTQAGIGMSVMHDALHGSYSSNPIINRWVGYSTYFVGGNPFVWKIQHNVFHHTYTNVHGLDEDIKTKIVLRLSHHASLRWIHRYQYIYAFFLYGFNTLFFTISDFIKLLNYHRMGMIKRQKSALWVELAKLIFTKLLYIFFLVVLPIWVTPLFWWQVLIGVLAMHIVSGYILTLIFQMAHIVEGVDQPLPNAEGDIDNAWAIHQLDTTANFARNNRLLNWYVGGLNFQIEHHLFPNICHVHYPKISRIVEQTAKEFQLRYQVMPTFVQGLQSHIIMLRSLGHPHHPVNA
ncbi:fatty acid desaturase family protein [Tunicatimonas pelagia]|uniref:fatty acid desaturase family protein n=1 Tax=Tunicatimonas pelagia TaxID=931531 RepID=UPI002666301B|nr:acyl-CoA desaturase [Tunicatimonas pelagia]WKN43291.1 acyl-CoA desaturase [Tunicatimonas pelagia]